MSVDRFSELSAERFGGFDETQQGRNVLLFLYHNYDNELPSPVTGLWLSRQLSKKRLETAHYIPDSACEQTLRSSGATSRPSGPVWLGLLVECSYVDDAPKANITVPAFLIENFSHLTIDPQSKTLVPELEDRFNVTITVAS